MEREAQGLKLSLGDKAPYFSLRGTDEKIHSLPDYAKKSALVVVFTCNHCPYAQAYETRLVEMANEFLPQGAQFVAICSNDSLGYPEDDFEHMVAKSHKLNLPFPYLHDESQEVARAYDAACTPEVFIFDANQELRYHGRIDDNYKDESKVSKQDLRNALQAVLLGEPPEEPMTPCIGCSIKWKA